MERIAPLYTKTSNWRARSSEEGVGIIVACFVPAVCKPCWRVRVSCSEESNMFKPSACFSVGLSVFVCLSNLCNVTIFQTFSNIFPSTYYPNSQVRPFT